MWGSSIWKSLHLGNGKTAVLHKSPRMLLYWIYITVLKNSLLGWSPHLLFFLALGLLFRRIGYRDVEWSLQRRQIVASERLTHKHKSPNVRIKSPVVCAHSHTGGYLQQLLQLFKLLWEICWHQHLRLLKPSNKIHINNSNLWSRAGKDFGFSFELPPWWAFGRSRPPRIKSQILGLLINDRFI